MLCVASTQWMDDFGGPRTGLEKSNARNLPGSELVGWDDGHCANGIEMIDWNTDVRWRWDGRVHGLVDGGW